MRSAITFASLLMTVFTSTASGQTGWRFSAQGSGLGVGLDGKYFLTPLKPTVGWEGQVRYTASRLSVGVGFQSSRHAIEAVSGLAFKPTGLRVQGPFIEPRYVLRINSQSVAPYLSARIAILTAKAAFDDFDTQDPAFGFVDFSTQLNGWTGFVGGGILVRVSSRINIDLGATFGYSRFGDVTVTVPGLPGFASVAAKELGVDSGLNYVARLGLAVGLF